MQINEVKIGDLVTFKNKQGKLVKGKVIHRHGDEKAHLAGHVNIEKIGGVASYPFTVHVSKIKPVTEENTPMDFKQNIRAFLDAILADNKVEALEQFNTIMQEKADDVLDVEKVAVANTLFATEETITQEEFEALSEEEQAEWEPVESDDEEELDEDHDVITQEEFDALPEEEQAEWEAIELEEGNMENKAKKNAYVKSVGQQAHWTAKAGASNAKQAGRNQMRPQPHDSKDSSRAYKKSPSEYWKSKGMNTGVHKEAAENLGEDEYDSFRDYHAVRGSWDHVRKSYGSGGGYSSGRSYGSGGSYKRKASSSSSSSASGSHSVHIDGKKWKSFGSHSHASNVAKKLEAKGKKATVHKD